MSFAPYAIGLACAGVIFAVGGALVSGHEIGNDPLANAPAPDTVDKLGAYAVVAGAAMVAVSMLLSTL